MKQGLVLTNTVEVPIRFSETDAMGIVWHGNYIKYFEDGREAFGKQFQLEYLDIYGVGFTTPIVHLVCDYKLSLRYGDTARIETSYHESPAAKILYKYKIWSVNNGTLAASGESIQVFTNLKGELQLTVPDFFDKWKERWR